MKAKHLTATIHSFSHDGRGIAHIQGKTVFIEGALPNEMVQFKYVKRNKRFDEGKVISILEAAVTSEAASLEVAPERKTPACSHFLQCGGCTLQHVSSQFQLKHKEQVLLEQLKHFGKVVPKQILPAIESANEGYRQKVRLSVFFDQTQNQYVLGLKEKQSSKIIGVRHCTILDPAFSDILPAIIALLNQLKKPDCIKQIEIAKGEGSISFALVLYLKNSLPQQDITQLSLFEEKQNTFIFISKSDQDLKSLSENKTEEKFPLLYRYVPADLEYYFNPHQFIQVNSKINQRLIEEVLKLLDLNSNERVLDLFCGIGNFTLPIALKAKEVIGIEGNASALEAAEFNAQKNAITNSSFYCDNLYEDCQNAPWAKQPFDAIVLDPPRTGAKEILGLLHTLNPSKIVYISCQPSTLARDLNILVHQFGFTLESIRIFDMFPETSHIETLAFLTRSKETHTQTPTQTQKQK